MVDDNDLIVGGYFTQAGHARCGLAWPSGTDRSGARSAARIRLFGITALALWNGHLVAGGRPTEDRRHDPPSIGVRRRELVAARDHGRRPEQQTSASTPSPASAATSTPGAGSRMPMARAPGASRVGMAPRRHAVGSGFPAGGVLALTVHGTKLVAGGFFPAQRQHRAMGRKLVVADQERAPQATTSTRWPAMASISTRARTSSDGGTRTSWATLTGLGGVFGLAISQWRGGGERHGQRQPKRSRCPPDRECVGRHGRPDRETGSLHRALGIAAGGRG